MKTELTQEQVRELFDYDFENGWLIKKTFRSGCPYNKPCGNKPVCDGYGRVRIGENLYLTHRVIWFWVHGYMPEFIDHKNRDRMDNRIENLRAVSASENQHNQGLLRNNTSGFHGVNWDKQNQKYRGRITINSKRIHLGLFNTAEEAYLAYQLAKIKYHPTSPIAQEYLRELTLAG